MITREMKAMVIAAVLCVSAILIGAAFPAHAQNTVGNVSNNGGIVTVGQTGGITAINVNAHAETLRLESPTLGWSNSAQQGTTLSAAMSPDGQKMTLYGDWRCRATSERTTVCVRKDGQ